MEMEFCKLSPELEDHFEIFEHIRGFNVTIVTSANTQDETLPPWSGFFQKDEGESQRKLYKFVKIPIDLVICGTNIVRSCPSCQEIVPLHENRCISTGRPRSVYQFFRISRLVFRGLASRGPLMGIKKSSW
ncbi:LOW QUALITY PROTEIN: hypothetical protein OSB04_001560 [Centaurea solstitialis]|uniref:Small ribosomal subunit protein uS14m n=1 Tax=Centaurea solstitialis TaxID=347529 RepID=A0AA38WUI1_9ASTR|nr:LOW QUALITY PROTEIN: hypothetical protein OSB04_001560 [Centaurea solstitialis]